MNTRRWLNGALAERYGWQYLGAQFGRWHCMNCGTEAPYSWWKAVTGWSLSSTESDRL